MKYRKDFLDRFWDKIDVRDEDSCWEWIGSENNKGYGTFRLTQQRTTYAHRTMWELTNAEEIGNNLVVMHSCDNPSCVNPKHLRVGTHSDNISDMVRKGRGLVGEKNGKSKFINSEILEIKRLIFEENLRLTDIARKFGVSRSFVSRIKLGQRWSHLQQKGGDQ